MSGSGHQGWYQTIRKQDSLWENHLKARFGHRFVDDITAGEVNDYLAELYYTEGFSYQYTESFLKMFYLIFGQAYSHDHLEVTAYNKLCTNKNTKIRMPKMKAEDDTDIVSFTREQLAIARLILMFRAAAVLAAAFALMDFIVVTSFFLGSWPCCFALGFVPLGVTI